MAQFLEFEDKHVETAVKRASEELNIPKDKLKYDVISYGSSGIFGLVGFKKARIRVTLPANKTPTKKRDGKSGTVAENGAGNASLNAESGASTDQEPGEKPDQKSEQEEIADTISSLMEETFDAPAITEAPTAGTIPGPVEPLPDATAETMLPPEETTGPEAPPTLAPDNQTSVPIELNEDMEAALQKGLEALQRIIDFITTDAQVVVERDAERVLFDVKGGNAGVLIGRRGQTLEAIQYLVEKIVNKNADDRVRVQVDIEGYLEGRRTRLQELAAKLASKAKRAGKPVTLGQLNSHDRRIVHLSLRDDAEVRTQSQGDGFYRKLVIFPKKKGHKKKNT